MSSKRPPELTWQDKAILVSVPVMVFVIFILANYLGQDMTVSEAMKQKLSKVEVRDSGHVVQVYPVVATDTISCRLKTSDDLKEFDFDYVVTGSDTLKFEVGRQVQFYGIYSYNEKGGLVSAPYKGKSGRMSGWVIYENHRYLPKTDDKHAPL